VKLAALGQFYHWSRAELLDLTPQDIAWWSAAAGQFNELVAEASKRNG
jgi:hypothetical protein